MERPDIEMRPEEGISYAFIKGVRGTLNPKDVEVIAKSAIDMPPNGRYLETGSYLGCSALIVAYYATNATIWAHDLWVTDWSELKGTPPPVVNDYFYEFYKNVKDNGFENRIIPIRGDSKYTIGIHSDDSIDLAFIDGDHSYDGCLGDLRAVWPKMKKRGRVLVHDCCIKETMDAVRTFLKEVAVETEIAFHDTWGMVGLVK
jgi:predicted O-methyltransferase YrrM